MSCDQFNDLYELYALGSLSGEELPAFEAHLREGCIDCRSAVQQARELNEMILSATPLVQPSPLLRRRVLAAFGQPVGERRRPTVWIAALAVAAAILVAFGLVWNQERDARKANELELARLREIQQILQSPDTKQVNFGPQPAAPHGDIFVHEKLGILLIANNMPAAPAGWTYESWLIPKNGDPVPVEAFSAQQGRGVSVMPSSLPLSDLKAVAVSLEPLNAPVKKPTKVLFAAPLA